MVISTQVSLDSDKSIKNLFSKSTKNTLLNRTSDEISKLVDNSRSNVHTSTKKDFCDVLNSKTVSKKEYDNEKKVDFSEKSDSKSQLEGIKESLDDLKEKLDNLDEDFDSMSKEDIDDLLSSLLSVINQLMESEQSDNLNFINLLIDINNNVDENLNTLQKLIETLAGNETKGNLDAELFNKIKEAISNLNNKLADDSDADKTIKNYLNDLVSKISNKEEGNTKQDNVQLIGEQVKNQGSSEQQSSSKNSAESSLTKQDNQLSKEEKFLNSLLDNKDEPLDKMNFFNNLRTQNIQGQNTDVKALTINKATFTSDIIKDVKFMTTNSIKELIVKVNPGNIGEITISLVQEDGIMKANLKASSKETTALLAQNIEFIKKEIGEQNIKIAEVNIELYNEDTTFYRNEEFGRQLFEGEDSGKNKNSKTESLENINSLESEQIDNIAELNNNLDILA